MPLVQHDSVLLNSEPVKKSWWTLEVEGPGSLGPFPKDLDWQVRNVPALASQVSPVQVVDVNSSLNIPGQKLSTCGDFRFHLYSADKILKWWRAWHKLVYDESTGAIGLYSEIVGQAKVILWVPGEGEKAAPVQNRTFLLRDLWPTSITVEGLDREDDGSPVSYDIGVSIADVLFNDA